MNRQFTKNILVDLRKEEDARFRKSINADSRDFILFLGTGNRPWEQQHMFKSSDAIEKFVFWVKARKRNFILVMPFETDVNEVLIKELASKLGIRIICP